MTGEIIRRSEAPAIGHHFRHDYWHIYIYKSMISEWRRQLKSAGLAVTVSGMGLYYTGLPDGAMR